MSFRSKVLDMFPTPAYMLMPANSLVLSDEAIRFVELKRENDITKLSRYQEIELQEGVIESGKIQNTKKLLDILKKLKEEKGLKFVAVSLPEERGYIYTTTIPNVPREEIRQQIEFTIEENVPLSVDSVVFEFTCIDLGVEKDKKRVVVTVLPKSVVQDYVDIFNKAGLIPIYFEIESSALSRAVIAKDDDRVNLLVNIGKHTTNISIVDEGIVRFTSTSHNGVDDILKGEEGGNIDWLSSEIKRVENYWFSHGDGGNNIENIIICGEGFDREDFSKKIISQIGDNVKIADVWQNIVSFEKHVPDISYKDSLRYGVSLGIAIGELKRKYEYV